ncbi:MAG: zinc ABC transporter substrate-binding protein [Candidatus Thioglobus sp.]|nr:zinc ABC transporter substrate-binding protein [Candidatus Thioglobus sp.]
MNHRFLIFLTLLLSIGNAFAQSSPIVVTSIKPIHSIVSSLMDGAGQPELLLKSNNSAHTFHLKPSQIRMISEAHLVITVDENFEIGLKKALKNISSDSLMYVSDIDNLKIYSARDSIFEEDEEHGHSNLDYHLWLSTENVLMIADRIASRLKDLDPSNEMTYVANLEQFNSKMDKLNLALDEQLKSIQSKRIAVIDDTLQYFEKGQMLKRPVIVTPYHGARLSVKRTLEAKRMIKHLNISCLVYGIDNSPSQVKALSEGLALSASKIDILGSEFSPGPDLYFNIMNQISSQIRSCLE